jgi:hypothetical protein
LRESIAIRTCGAPILFEPHAGSPDGIEGWLPTSGVAVAVAVKDDVEGDQHASEEPRVSFCEPLHPRVLQHPVVGLV